MLELCLSLAAIAAGGLLLSKTAEFWIGLFVNLRDLPPLRSVMFAEDTVRGDPATVFEFDTGQSFTIPNHVLADQIGQQLDTDAVASQRIPMGFGFDGIDPDNEEFE